MNPLIKKLDHQTLNNIKGLENPTSENIAKWFWKNLKKKISKLESVELTDQESVGVYMAVRNYLEE